MESKKKNNINPIKWVSLLLIVIVLLVTLGYSSLTDGLMVDDAKAAVRIQKDIRITNFRNYSMSNGATSDFVEYSYKSVHSTISLPNNNSSVTYDVEVTNIGNVEMGIVDIVGLPSNLKYTLVGYTLESTLCDSSNNLQCKLGSVTRFQITLEYDTNGYDGITTDFNIGLTFVFDEIDYTARIGSIYYQSLQDAANAVPMDHTETTIVLLKNSAESISVTAGKNIVLDLQGLVLSNPDTGPIVTINGAPVGNSNIRGASVKLSNGTIYTTGTQGAVNVETEGTFTMTGGRIEATNNRQAIYVDNGGTAIISGTSYLVASAEVEASATGKKRGTVQTVAGGTLTILGGTIEAIGTRGIAVSNAGTTTIGTKDGNVSTTSPVLHGEDYGVYITSGTFNYYDGVARGKVAAFQNESLINDKETDYSILHDDATIGGYTYHTAILSYGAEVKVTFDLDGGTSNETERNVLINTEIGTLPVPTRSSYTFDGWWTTDGSRQIDAHEVITAAVTFRAHWIAGTFVAKIGNTPYATLAEAVAAVPNNTQTTIILYADVTEQVTIGSRKNIVLDIGNHTLHNNGAKSVLEITGGTVTMISGTITTSTTQGAVNVKSGGTFNISGGSIISSGTKQTIYIENGRATISGTALLRAKALVETSNKRGTVHVLAGNTLTVTGGTIEAVGENGIAISNFGTTTIGSDDGNIDTTTPVIKSTATGIYNDSGVANFNDGIIKAKTTCVYGNALVIPSGASIVNSSETIDSVVYFTNYLN